MLMTKPNANPTREKTRRVLELNEVEERDEEEEKGYTLLVVGRFLLWIWIIFSFCCYNTHNLGEREMIYNATQQSDIEIHT